jgi:hypothetical protein
VVARTLAVVALALLVRVPSLHQPVQGDDPYYLYGAEHAQIDPLHPAHARYIFQGELVDMRGHPHPPLNAWILGSLLAAFGDVNELQFHHVYALFSVIAALAMWSLARRFCEKPFLATLLFLAVPAFVVNGNSFEADLPFLAFWMAAIALFVKAVDGKSTAMLVASTLCGALAGLAAYQAVFLVPVLAVYLYDKRRNWAAASLAIFAAPAAITAWLIFEKLSSGTLPATVLAGYLSVLETAANKLRSATALLVHSAWIVSPLIVAVAFGSKKRWIAAAIASAAAFFYDPNPLFWISIGCGVLLIAACLRRGFLESWILIVLAGAMIVFFAGSARYLLPIAAPVAILAARACPSPVLFAGFALQMALSLSLAFANMQHWDAYRQFAAALARQSGARRVWINAEWGLRYYLESAGGLPMLRDQTFRPGEIVVTSALALPLAVRAPLAPLAETEIRPAIPLRLISLDHRSAYSAASPHGLLPFEISTRPVDRVRAGIVVEQRPTLSSFDPRDPAAASQIVTGLFPDGWMSAQATVLLKRADPPSPLRVSIYIPDAAPARQVRVLVDGRFGVEQAFARPGLYTLTVPDSGGAETATITVSVDKTFSTPQDQRKLGVIVTKIGF